MEEGELGSGQGWGQEWGSWGQVMGIQWSQGQVGGLEELGPGQGGSGGVGPGSGGSGGVRVRLRGEFKVEILDNKGSPKWNSSLLDFLLKSGS